LTRNSLVKKRINKVLNTCNTQRAQGLGILKVTVDYLGSIKQTLGLKQAEQVQLKDDAAVRDLLSLLAEKHGEPFKKAVYEPKDLDLKAHHILSVNGLLLNQLNGIETKLKDGDHVILMPVVTGG
jgi:molybdopterin synthase sulfur carrier subunit